ncbi:reverse transcriptase domain-containing protein [Pseudanabaena sp. UWO310]|uniref:reverse transcriptase domain-containing protein n=1 Tax=Pseudanabaena sp. UWO310 TaxID=2480795 RepID=UPI00115962EE|nr:reverse transcriptase domain-containing protein [Pseudanabaena sp. UWO310]TYQ31122.1 hypothetical protein PseudUWO310_05090 [Pseudanabaena sp. UWO310]
MLCDKDVIEFFTKENLKEIFEKYKKDKTDFFNQDIIKVPMGADGISLETFNKEIDIRCQIISNRIKKGTYQFYPLREVEIEKTSGGTRILSIAAIRDIVVQKALYDAIYKEIEKDFRKTDNLSFAYRKNKSAPQAALKIYRFIQEGYTWVLDADIVKFFDTIPHPYLIQLIEEKFGKNTLISNLLRRYIKTSRIHRIDYNNPKEFHCKKGKKIQQNNNQGIPQGGVLSGILANLYLHGFDIWILETLSKKYDLKYIRYADDFVVLSRNQENSENIYKEIKEKLTEIKLQLHEIQPDNQAKTKIFNLQETSLQFVGFEIALTKIRVKSSNIQKFKNRIYEKINGTPDNQSKSKNNIVKSEKDYKSGFDPRKRFNFLINKIIKQKIRGRTDICPLCDGVRKNDNKEQSIERNWLGFFCIITDIEQLRDIDKWIRCEISKYFYKTYNLRLKRKHFKQAGLISVEKEYYRMRKQKECDCITNQPDVLLWKLIILIFIVCAVTLIYFTGFSVIA